MTAAAQEPTDDPIDPEWKPAAHADVAAVELDGETVVYHERAGGLHLLNATATVIWQHLDGEVTLRGLAADLAEATGADPARVEADVLAAARDFRELGLLRPADDAPATAATPTAHERHGDTEGDDGPRIVEVPGSR